MQKSTSSVAWDPAVILGSNKSTLSVWHDGKAAVPFGQYSQWKCVHSLTQFQILHMKSSSSCGRKPCPNHLYLFSFYFSAYIKWQFNATEQAFSCPLADFGSFTALLLQEGVRVEKFAVFLQMQCSYICPTAVKSRDCGELKKMGTMQGNAGNAINDPALLDTLLNFTVQSLQDGVTSQFLTDRTARSDIPH